VAWRQGHVVHIRRVPGRNNQAPGIRVGADFIQNPLDLVDHAAIGGGPAAPLFTIDGSEVAILVGPVVPDGNAIVLEIADIGVALQEPEQFDNDRTQVQLLGRDHRETVSQIKAHLAPEHGPCAGSRAICAFEAVFENV